MYSYSLTVRARRGILVVMQDPARSLRLRGEINAIPGEPGVNHSFLSPNDSVWYSED